jgi:hypothetical protein
MHWFDSKYPQYFNRRHRRVGHLYEQIDLKPRSDDYPRFQRIVGAPMAVIVAAVAKTLSIDEILIRDGRGGLPRMLAAWIGWHEALLTNREIAAGLRISTIRRKTGETKA